MVVLSASPNVHISTVYLLQLYEILSEADNFDLKELISLSIQYTNKLIN